jgi:hypothetical protein
MSKRIRYVNTETDGVVVSKQHFIHSENGSRYLVKINEPALSFQVIEDLTGKVVVEGRKVNLHQVKQAAKDELTKLGISFEEEKRKVKETHAES